MSSLCVSVHLSKINKEVIQMESGFSTGCLTYLISKQFIVNNLQTFLNTFQIITIDSVLKAGKGGSSLPCRRSSRRTEAVKFMWYSIFPSVVLQPSVGPWHLLQFRNIFSTDDRTL
jgi:hypothetical protein